MHKIIALFCTLSVLGTSASADLRIPSDAFSPDASTPIMSYHELSGSTIRIGGQTTIIEEVFFGALPSGHLTIALLEGTTMEGRTIRIDNLETVAKVYQHLSDVSGVLLGSSNAGYDWVEEFAWRQTPSGRLSPTAVRGIRADGQAFQRTAALYSSTPCDPELEYGCKKNESDPCNGACTNPVVDEQGRVECDCAEGGNPQHKCIGTINVLCPDDGDCDIQKVCGHDLSNPTDCKCNPLP